MGYAFTETFDNIVHVRLLRKLSNPGVGDKVFVTG